MPSYPGAIFTPTTITDGTGLVPNLVTNLQDELNAIENELGIGVHGTVGSLADRLHQAMNSDGWLWGAVHGGDLADGARIRMRAGIKRWTEADAGDTDTNLRTITIPVPMPSRVKVAFVQAVRDEGWDPRFTTSFSSLWASNVDPWYAFAVPDVTSGSDGRPVGDANGFVVRLQNVSMVDIATQADPLPMVDKGLELHWIAFEDITADSNTDF